MLLSSLKVVHSLRRKTQIPANFSNLQLDTLCKNVLKDSERSEKSHQSITEKDTFSVVRDQNTEFQ